MKESTKPIIAFIALVFILTTPLYIISMQADKPMSSILPLIVAMMWMVTISAFAITFFFKLDWKMFGFFRLGPKKDIVFAFLLPVFACGIVYGFVWLSGLGTLDIEAFAKDKTSMDIINFFAFGLLTTTFFVLGEEIGWRGFFTPLCLNSFQERPFLKTVLIVGVIWALWHSPLIISGQYSSGNSAWVTLPAFVFNVMAVTIVLTLFRLRSQSFWSATALHVSHNTFIQGFFDVVTVDSSGWAEFITTEFGFGIGFVYLIVAYFMYKNYQKKV